VPPLTSRARAIASVSAALLYAIVLAWLKWVPRYDCITLVALLVGTFRVLDDAEEKDRTLALHAITQVLLGAFLVHLWTIGYEGRNAVFGGILPWSDSFDYYDDALRLVHGDRFTEFSSKRPIFGVVLAGLLRLSGGSLRFALVVCALAGGLAVAAVGREVWRTHGWKSALVVYLVLLFFERRWTGFIQTEHVGLPLGAIGFVLIWRANGCRKDDPSRAQRLVLVGLLSMAVGLMARAGAFFVLPAIAVWAARFVVPDKESKARFLGLAFGAMLGGFALHKVVLYATGTGVTFSDYPGIFYGLMHGEDYTYLSQTHPHLGTLSVTERVPEAWRIVTSEASSRPGLVVVGFAKSFAGLFTSPFGMFSYVWTNPDDHVLESKQAVDAAMAEHGIVGPLLLWKRTLGLYSLLNAGAMGVLGAAFVLGAIASIVRLVRRRRDPDRGLLRWTTMGILCSAPFTPPWITSGQQVQTVTLAFAAALPAILLARTTTQAADDTGGKARDRIAWAPFGFVAALGVLVAMLRLAPSRPPACDASRAHVMMVYDGTTVIAAPARAMDLRRIAIDDLRFSARVLAKHNPELTDSLVPYLKDGARYVAAFDACDRRAKLLVDDEHVAIADGAYHPIDVEPLATPKVLHVQRPPALSPAPPDTPVDP
jgi:hypothetical protein